MPADTLAAALASLQKDLPRIVKDKTATVTSQRTGKTHKYSYAGLPEVAAEIMPKLADQGLSFSCRPTLHPEFGFVLAYQLLHTSGEERSGFYPLNAEDSPQARGSAITYARRYCLCAITGVAADEDDDAQAAEHARSDGLPVNKDGSLSRRRTTDGEKEVAGVMTSAQQDEHTELQKGAARGRVQGTERLAVVPDDDPFYDPLSDADPVDPGLVRSMNIRLTNAGHRTKEQRLAKVLAVTGRKVTSTDDLSDTEVRQVIAELDGKAAAR